MRSVIQRVTCASVTVGGEVVGSIGEGLLVLLGVKVGDTEKDADYMADKLLKLRIFEDEAGKMNLSVADIGGEALVVSNFTLLAAYRKGNRPDFMNAALPETARPLYEQFLAGLGTHIPHVAHGEFGADMQVALTNDGPITIVMDSNVLKLPKR